MSNRSAKFVSALFATILAGANFSAVAENTSNTAKTNAAAAKTAETKTADSCLSGPKGTAPAGSHWRYRVERGTKRQCWYLGEEKKSAKAAPAEQDAAATDADAAPVQAAPVMRQSVANARAELQAPQAQAPQANAAPVAPASPAAPDSGASANAPSSAVSTRWFDSSSMGNTNGTRLAAAQPGAPAPVEAAPAQPAAQPAAPPAPASIAPERPSSSTQMLLIVMVGALALAALVGALVFKLTRTRTPPYQIRDEWRAPWDSLHTERAPTLMPRDAVPMRLTETAPRRVEPPITRPKAAPDAETMDAETTQQIAAMLQRLARSTAT